MSREPGGEQPEQPALLPREAARASARAARAKPPPAGSEPAAVDPVARVLVDVPLAHLDRPFDYTVPARLAEAARPGVRVKVRFAGKDVDGFVLDRLPSSAHPGRLQPLRRVIGEVPVLTAEVAELCRRVAERYAGTRSDVLRLAVPPRHATAEKAAQKAAEQASSPAIPPADPRPWRLYRGGPAMLSALAAGGSPRAVWGVAPGEDWTLGLAEAALATAASGRGVLVCVPDHRDIARLDAALRARWDERAHALLTADLGPSKRYTAFLRVLRGTARVVIGTRAAAFAPVADLGLVAIWDDGDDLHQEPRAPYPHTREVLLERAQQTGCAVLVAGYARSAEAQYLLRTGWARELVADRAALRRRMAFAVTGDSDTDLERDPLARSSRLPKEAYETIRAGLARGPVLVQTPRAGYATRLACARCREPAGCERCHGPLRIVAARRPPECAWCGTSVPSWTCPRCGARGLRAPVLGERRTAEELGRAFTDVPVRTSSAGHVVAEVPDRPALVVATTGAEPVAVGGYAAVVLLDTWLLLARSDLRAAEEAVRRWANAAALVRDVEAGGRVLAVGDPAARALQALIRWDPGGFADREIEDRRSAHLPPASRVATLVGPAADLEEVAGAEELSRAVELPGGTEVLGPVPDGEEHRLVLRVPRRQGPELVAALRALQGVRSARKLTHLRVEVDPMELG